MKNRRRSLAAAAFILVAPSFAVAQTAPTAQPATAATAPGGPSVVQTEVSAGLSIASDMSRTQQQARASMLAALTPTHRALVAQIVGELAVAPDPNFDAAAMRLDAALRPAEVQAIAHAMQVERYDTLAEVGQLKSTFEKTLTPDQMRQMNEANVDVAKAVAPGGDPGHVLLQTVLLGVQPYSRMLLGASRR